MKKQLRKILITSFIWVVLFALIAINYNVMAVDLNVSLSADKTKYEVGDEVTITVNTNKNVITASYYLNYDSTLFEFKDKSENLSVKDYPENGVVRAVYIDMTGKGTQSMKFVFKVKNSSDNETKFSLTKTTMSPSDNDEAYKQKNSTLEQIIAVGKIKNNNSSEKNINKTTEEKNNNENNEIAKNNTTTNTTNTNNNIKQNSSISKVDTSTSTSKTMPKVGLDGTLLYLIIGFIIVSIYLGLNLIKLRDIYKN